MIEIRKTLWDADPANRERLIEILQSPVFINAVEIVFQENHHGCRGTIEGMAIEGARRQGMADMIDGLNNLTKKQKQRTTTQKVPWSHITEEKSVFGDKPKSNQQPK